MYDDLRKALAHARSAVAWYALGEAIKLTGYIDIVVPQHRDNPGNETAEGNLMKVAKAVEDFLRRHSTAERDVLNALQQAITTIEMEV
jgi:hypothetical protein